VYLPERQVEYWTSRQIEDFLWDAGFQTQVLPLTQRTELHIPADFIFLPSGQLKMFGIQYKVLYQGTPDYWSTPQQQADQIAKFDWIYYGLSDLKNIRDSRNALYALRLCEASRIASPVTTVTHMYRVGYSRWWRFYEQLIGCKFGRRVRDIGDFLGALSPVWDELPKLTDIHGAVDVLLLNSESQRAIHFSTLQRDIGTNPFQR
jgi:hypothetical protein